MKVALIILSDPTSGTEEATGRLFNALASALDFKNKGDEVSILFQGTGTRWIEELTNPDHPFHELFEAVKDNVLGISCGCGDVFGGSEDAENLGYALLTDNPVPGTRGLPSLQRLIREGHTILTF